MLGCASVLDSTTTACPPPVWLDEPVANELANLNGEGADPYPGYEDLWDWLDKIEKLNEQLEACRDG